jgi:hypothetical protein
LLSKNPIIKDTTPNIYIGILLELKLLESKDTAVLIFFVLKNEKNNPILEEKKVREKKLKIKLRDKISGKKRNKENRIIVFKIEGNRSKR